MNRISKKTLIFIASVMIISNIPPFSGLFRLFLDEKHYKYSTYNGSFTFVEFMSRNFEMGQRIHKTCLIYTARDKRTYQIKDKQMYRLFTINPLAFWRWATYFYDEKYDLPYRDWEEIKKVMVKENINNRNTCYKDDIWFRYENFE